VGEVSSLVDGCYEVSWWQYRLVAHTATAAAQTIQFRGGLQAEWSDSEQYQRRYEVVSARFVSLISRVQILGGEGV
jgi:hypothetical protein